MARHLAHDAHPCNDLLLSKLQRMDRGSQWRARAPRRRRLQLTRTRTRRGELRFGPARTRPQRREIALCLDQVDRYPARIPLHVTAQRFDLVMLAVGELDTAAELVARFGVSAQRAGNVELTQRQRCRCVDGRRVEIGFPTGVSFVERGKRLRIRLAQ